MKYNIDNKLNNIDKKIDALEKIMGTNGCTEDNFAALGLYHDKNAKKLIKKQKLGNFLSSLRDFICNKVFIIIVCAIVIVCGCVFGVTAIVKNVKEQQSKRDEYNRLMHEVKDISFSVDEKKEEVKGGTTYSVLMLALNNGSKTDISTMNGDLTVEDVTNGKTIASYTTTLNGPFKANSEGTITLYLNGDTLLSYSLEGLKIYFELTNILFADGETGNCEGLGRIIIYNGNANYNDEEYMKAIACYNAKNYTESYDMFRNLGNYKESKDYVSLCVQGVYEDGLDKYACGELVKAYKCFSQVSFDFYEDSSAQMISGSESYMRTIRSDVEALTEEKVKKGKFEEAFNDLIAVDCDNANLLEVVSFAKAKDYSGVIKYYNLTSFTVPSNVDVIGYQCFYNCSSLVTVNLPEGLKEIRSQAFSGCSSLSKINIPSSVTAISDAFSGCSKLTSVNISDVGAWCNISFYGGSVTSNPLYYANNLYLNNVKVTNLVIPNTVTKINDYAFSGCKSLKSVKIPDSVKSIGNYAFRYCDNLTSVIIGKGVSSIGEYAFRSGSGFNVYYAGTANEWNSVSVDFSIYNISKIVYYYSKTQPSATGRYWHYDSNGAVAIW